MSLPVGAVVDAVESWLVARSFWIQVPLLLAVLIPLSYLLAGLIDKVVERLLRPRVRREIRDSGVHPAGRGRES